MKLQDCYARSKTALETRIGTKVGQEHDLISWMIRHSAWLITRFRVRTSGHTAFNLIRQRKYGASIVEFGEIVWARIPTAKKLGKLDQRWVEVVWAGKAEGSDEHIGLDHRGARRFRAVRREPESMGWQQPDAFSRVAVFGDPASVVRAKQSYRLQNHRSKKMTGQTSRTHQSQQADADCTSLTRW